MSISKPAIVFCHGAWHCPEHYSPLTDRLSAAGYNVTSARLPSVGKDPAVTSFDVDVEEVRAALDKAVDTGVDVLLVVHSYGGCVGGEAAKGFLKEDRKTKGLQGGIVGTVYMCAFAPDVDENLAQWVELVLPFHPAVRKLMYAQAQPN